MNIEHHEVTYPNFERVKTRLEAGEIIIYGRPDLLLLDLDSEEAFTEFQNRREFSQNVIGEKNYLHRKSPSGRGYHVFIQTVGDYRIRTRIAMQAMLGSDFKRDLLSMNTVTQASHEVEEDLLFNDQDYRNNPIFLFEKDGIETLPEWVISKADILKQRSAWIVTKAEKYGLKAVVTIPEPRRVVTLPIELGSDAANFNHQEIAAKLRSVDKPREVC